MEAMILIDRRLNDRFDHCFDFILVIPSHIDGQMILVPVFEDGFKVLTYKFYGLERVRLR